MHIQNDTDELARRLSGFIARVPATAENQGREAYRAAFRSLRPYLTLHPRIAPHPSDVFESAASTVRRVATHCLPFATALVMHLYPLCALQCVPIPLFSPARMRRAMLLRKIRKHSLILANAGSERSRGTQPMLTATLAADGLRVSGTCDYMSLSSVADVVLLKASIDGSNDTALCAASLRGDSVHVGPWTFQGTLRLSDTSCVIFDRHRVPHGRYLILRDAAGLQCIADYQRCWFHLFLAEAHIARLEQLHDVWSLPRTTPFVVNRNEMDRLREYSLHLLNAFESGDDVSALMRTTSALKLRASLMAQDMVTTLRAREEIAGDERLAADIAELSCIRFQPTADARIVQSLCARPQLSGTKRDAISDGRRSMHAGLDLRPPIRHLSSVCSQNIWPTQN